MVDCPAGTDLEGKIEGNPCVFIIIVAVVVVVVDGMRGVITCSYYIRL